VYPIDLLGSMYQQLGIDTEAKLPHPLGLSTKVIDPDQKSGGRLKEIL
jgi:hypothetical protein